MPNFKRVLNFLRIIIGLAFMLPLGAVPLLLAGYYLSDLFLHTRYNAGLSISLVAYSFFINGILFYIGWKIMFGLSGRLQPSALDGSYDLDQSIAAWRQQLVAAGLNSPTVLDELETHLREDIQRRIQTGVYEPADFTAAAQSLGSADKLKSEFLKPDVLSASVWRTVQSTGSNGFGITLAFNLFVLLAPWFSNPAAIFFSTGWWAYWFPAYAILLVLAVVGSVAQRSVVSGFAVLLRNIIGVGMGCFGVLLMLDAYVQTGPIVRGLLIARLKVSAATFDSTVLLASLAFSGFLSLAGLAVCWCAWKFLRSEYTPAHAPRPPWFSSRQ